ncbi:hypothetical protein G5714_015297 [Onychostoma macrolepis]|uniref:Uncharacterized protein n=1 Tax=Onychostoma macrolepis TaxID=369639 RepID=A0A7J6CAU0_9TELE|nr:hypothetical protein G5714_015297 [Onychostoma macrolepis]
MTSANHPRFRLLIGWCCLMSSVLLIITVYLIYNKGIPPKTGQNAKSEKSTAGNEVPNSSGHPSGSFSNDYMHLIRDPTEIWICHPCKNTSFSQKNSTVEITISGLYYFHAQVTFSHDNIQGTVILRKNKEVLTQMQRAAVKLTVFYVTYPFLRGALRGHKIKENGEKG